MFFEIFTAGHGFYNLQSLSSKVHGSHLNQYVALDTADIHRGSPLELISNSTKISEKADTKSEV